MTYLPEDEQPSIFLLKENSRQSILTIFNWSNNSRTHTITLPSLGLSRNELYTIDDVLDKKDISLSKSDSLVVNQAAHSVRVLKIINPAITVQPPRVKAEHPFSAKAGETVTLSAQLPNQEIPILSYRWDFGDGVTLEGPQVSHTYTHTGNYQVKLTAEGLDGLTGEDNFNFSVNGSIPTTFIPAKNRRYKIRSISRPGMNEGDCQQKEFNQK